jgi:hypothetical protein
MLVLLGLQYEFGMAVNLANLPSLPALGLSFSNILGALQQAGAVAFIHAALGTSLTVVSVIGLVLALSLSVRSVQVFGVPSFLSIVLAEVNGILFALSGFQDNNYSHGMATMFLLTFASHFLELHFLRLIRRSLS